MEPFTIGKGLVPMPHKDQSNELEMSSLKERRHGGGGDVLAVFI